MDPRHCHSCGKSFKPWTETAYHCSEPCAARCLGVYMSFPKKEKTEAANVTAPLPPAGARRKRGKTKPCPENQSLDSTSRPSRKKPTKSSSNFKGRKTPKRENGKSHKSKS